MANVRVVLVTMAWSSAGCSLLYDTGDLRGEGGTDAPGGGGASTTATAPSTSSAGGGGSAGCECEPARGIVWLVQSPGSAIGAPAPTCPDGGTPLAEGGLSNSLVDESSECGGPCNGLSGVKVAIDDSCGVSGEGVPNDMSCNAKTLVPDTAGDTSLSINLEPIPCTLPSPSLVDTATLTRASACQPVGDACDLPASARACLPAVSSTCSDPCFSELTTIATIEDTRSCAGVLATCSPPVFGTLELHDNAACAGAPSASWSIVNAPICPAAPGAPASPTTSYWKYAPASQSCDAFGSPNGAVVLEQAILELCCAPQGG